MLGFSSRGVWLPGGAADGGITKLIGAAGPYLVALLVVTASPAAFPADTKREALRFELDVQSAAQRYVELAKYPSYLAVVLHNNGFNPSQSSRIIIENGRTLHFRNAVVRFVREEKGVFHYNAVVEWSIGIAESKFDFPVEADLSGIGQGKVSIRIYPPLAEVFPQELTERIRLKLQSVANAAVQQRILEYLDAATGGAAGRPLDLPALIERILIDAYNLPAVAPGLAGAREPGDAEPLSDQVLLLITLFIWVVAPVAWIGWRRWRRRGLKGAG
jgi:hypothetical protein